MTDIKLNRIKAICEIAHVEDIEDLSDGYHTFRQLYYQRMMLFAALVKQNKGKAWKSLRHSDGELCFGGGWFIVGIDTPEGSYTYHYENKYFDLFDCEILDYGKQWDGHTEEDVTRLLSLEQGSCEDAISRSDILERCQLVIGQGHSDKNGYHMVSAETIMYVVKQLPSINPQPKTGHWIEVTNGRGGHECDVCHDYAPSFQNGDEYLSTFCPNCGAKIVEPRESEGNG